MYLLLFKNGWEFHFIPILFVTIPFSQINQTIMFKTIKVLLIFQLASRENVKQTNTEQRNILASTTILSIFWSIDQFEPTKEIYKNAGKVTEKYNSWNYINTCIWPFNEKKHKIKGFLWELPLKRKPLKTVVRFCLKTVSPTTLT